MNTLKITVSCERKAALLNGLVLGETCEVEVSPESIGAEWPALVKYLDMSKETPRSFEIMVDAPTAESVKGWLEAKTAKRVADAQAKIEKYNGIIATMEAGAETYERMLGEPLKPLRIVTTNAQQSAHGLAAATYDGFVFDLPYVDTTWSWPTEEMRERAEAICERMDVARKSRIAQVEAANEIAFAAALPALLQAKADSEAKAAAAEVAKKEANKLKFAARLESGTWTKETSSYNEKRYGAWWVASIDFSSGSKGDYTFGDSSGKWGSAGELSIACAPGDFIAYGQKDLRRPDKSDHFVLQMRADGSMQSFDSKAEAYKAFKAAKVAA